MSNELQLASHFNESEMAMIEQMGLGNVPAPHIQTFLHIAKSMHLDPRLKRDIALISRNSKNGPTYTVQVGIAGYRKAARKIAKAEGETIKVDPWLFKGKEGDWTDAWDSSGSNPPMAAKCTVYRDGMPFTQVVMWNEFVQQYNGKPQALWATKPSYMLGKTAESLAWRQAFPDEMGSTYEESEVEAIHADSVRVSNSIERGADAVRAALQEKQAALEAKKEAKMDVGSVRLSIENAESRAELKHIIDRMSVYGLSDDEVQELKGLASKRWHDLAPQGGEQ